MRILMAGVIAALIMQAAEMRQPVLVELFTSEGCSSCPPADQLLQVLDRDPPVEGVEAVVLSEHVDYWNHIGWTDPYSSAAFSRRQEGYAARFRTQGPYTPQMIVDGANEFVGNDGRQATVAIAAAGKRTKVPVRLMPSANGNAVHVEIDPLGAGKSRSVPVWVALADNWRESSVLRGENRGRHLAHVSVVRSLREIGAVSTSAPFRADIPRLGAGRVIVFLQERGLGPVLGAAMLRLE